MRLLGYPPGWLEEARLQHSGLTLFNSDGMAEADPNDEEGEIIRNEDRDQYDLKKIYDFPGFNVPPPPGTIDVSKYTRAIFSIIHILNPIETWVESVNYRITTSTGRRRCTLCIVRK